MGPLMGLGPQLTNIANMSLGNLANVGEEMATGFGDLFKDLKAHVDDHVLTPTLEHIDHTLDTALDNLEGGLNMTMEKMP